MKITTVGIDLAKNVFQAHGVDERGKAVLKKKLKREQMAKFFANLPPCLIGMEACGSAHFWARKLQGFGHDVRLIAPQFVKPYVKTNKNDAADAEAICEAVSRPHMRFVPIKSVEQQAVLSLHRMRAGFIAARTAQANQIRGLLGEFGIIIPVGIANLTQRVPQILEEAGNLVPDLMRPMLAGLMEHLHALTHRAKAMEVQILALNAGNELVQRLLSIPGIGPITASVLVAMIGDGRHFHNARQVAAWLGLVPRQHSSGGKEVLLGISKRGDRYLRMLLIHGARAVVRVQQNKPAGEGDPWLCGLLARRNPNVAAVALANKNARTVWAILAHGRTYDACWSSRQRAVGRPIRTTPKARAAA
jgi:transposase